MPPEPTGAELCAMVAVEQGWKLREPASPEGMCREGGSLGWWREGEWGGCDRCQGPPTGDPLRSWEDFGRLWEWLAAEGCRSDAFSIKHDPQGKRSFAYVRIFDEVRSRQGLSPWRYVQRYGPVGDPRRALVLAFLKARGRL